MPKQTFFNLPNEKRETLIRAAKTEFSRVPLYEASIANIVKEAEIPRGSFYQYFEDKDDLYFYLLDKQGKDLWKRFFTDLETYNGNILMTLSELYRFILLSTDDEKECNYLRNVFLNMNYRTEKSFKHNVDHNEFRQQFIQVKNLINTQKLNLINEDDLFHIFQITTTLMFQNIIIKFAHNLSSEEALKNFTLQLDLIKRGILKKDA